MQDSRRWPHQSGRCGSHASDNRAGENTGPGCARKNRNCLTAGSRYRRGLANLIFSISLTTSIAVFVPAYRRNRTESRIRTARLKSVSISISGPSSPSTGVLVPTNQPPRHWREVGQNRCTKVDVIEGHRGQLAPLSSATETQFQRQVGRVGDRGTDRSGRPVACAR